MQPPQAYTHTHKFHLHKYFLCAYRTAWSPKTTKPAWSVQTSLPPSLSGTARACTDHLVCVCVCLYVRACVCVCCVNVLNKAH